MTLDEDKTVDLSNEEFNGAWSMWRFFCELRLTMVDKGYNTFYDDEGILIAKTDIDQLADLMYRMCMLSNTLRMGYSEDVAKMENDPNW